MNERFYGVTGAFVLLAACSSSTTSSSYDQGSQDPALGDVAEASPEVAPELVVETAVEVAPDVETVNGDEAKVEVAPETEQEMAAEPALDVPVEMGMEAAGDAEEEVVADLPRDQGVAMSLNGCDLAMAEDLTSQPTVTVVFGGTVGFAYSPACLRVKSGAQVTFNGSFSFHPLAGGTVSGGVVTPDDASPFLPPTSSGTSKTFTLTAKGAFGFYCTLHYGAGMKGAVFVE